MVLFSFPDDGYRQDGHPYRYLNPAPGSKYVSVTSNILVRPGALISRQSVNNSIITVTGSKSGLHQGNIFLDADNRTVLFTPARVFEENEQVSVRVGSGLLSADGVPISGTDFSFTTCKSTPFLAAPPAAKARTQQLSKNTKMNKVKSSLPWDYPYQEIDISNNPSSGYLFVEFYPYLVIEDNEGTPVFYRNVGGDIYDFKLQPDGELTYFVYPVGCYTLNNTFNPVRTLTTVNGYSVDVHDLRVTADGGYYILGKRVVTKDMSGVVSGGASDAQIIDCALQEFDASGNLVFEWDALDHYDITDLDDNSSLTDFTIDFAHFNSIEIDTDSNIILSARNLDEITKIDKTTGNIIWRFGGKNNQFTFINDAKGFSRQHDVRRFSNGNISIFDNGVFHANAVSSAVEYKLDESKKTATLIRRYAHDNTIFSPTEGSVQELPNGNRLIGWGNVYQPAVTEITPTGDIAFELSCEEFNDGYRAFRFNWETGLFTTNADTINFGHVSVDSTAARSFVIHNPQDSTLFIDEFYCRDNSFTTDAVLPLIIQPRDSTLINVFFKPTYSGGFSSALNLRVNGTYNDSPQMIARQVQLMGTTDDTVLITGNDKLPHVFNLAQNYPNPFNPTTMILYELPTNSTVTLELFNIQGIRVASLISGTEQTAGSYSIEVNASRLGLASGMYIYRLSAFGKENHTYTASRKMILLK